jgi:hypothetical protein
MGPAALALMGGSALLSARNAELKRKQQQANNLAQAETTRYSPWTGMQGQLDTTYNPDWLTAAFSGGVQGASAAQGLGVGGMGAAKPQPMQDMAMNQNPQLYGSSWSGLA